MNQNNNSNNSVEKKIKIIDESLDCNIKVEKRPTPPPQSKPETDNQNTEK